MSTDERTPGQVARDQLAPVIYNALRAHCIKWFDRHGATCSCDRDFKTGLEFSAHQTEHLLDAVLGPGDRLYGPRVWRSGEPEPGEDVRAVLDREGVLWSRTENGTWSYVDGHDGGYAHQVAVWDDVTAYGPLAEVQLPAVVTA